MRILPDDAADACRQVMGAAELGRSLSEPGDFDFGDRSPGEAGLVMNWDGDPAAIDALAAMRAP